jgi:hypothetical protein
MFKGEQIQAKKEREITEVENIDELSDLAPQIKDLLEKLSKLDLPEEEFINEIHNHNNSAEVPAGEVERFKIQLENGRVIEIGKDSDGRTGITYEL